MREQAPLAARMRPRTLDEVVGQDHIIGPGSLLRRAIQADRLFSSIILYGPPGTGKTELAKLQAYLRRKFDLDTIKVVARPKKKDSAEVFIDDEFVAVIYRDEEDGEISWNLQMAILEMDLED